VFERFTDRARRAVVLAQEESRMLNHNHIGTEHILLGLLREEEGVAAKALESLKISLGEVRGDVGKIIGEGQAVPPGHIPFTPRAKKVLELSLREALQSGHNFIGTEHILLGLMREGEGAAAQVLQKRGADLKRVRQTVIQLVSGYKGGVAEPVRSASRHASEPTSEAAPAGSSVAREDFPTCPSCFAPLAETLAARVLDVTVDDEAARVKVAYCGRCGAALGPIL